MSFDDPRAAKMELCAGAALFLNNKMERSRCPETVAHQTKFGTSDGTVFGTDGALLDHHGNAPVKSWEFGR